MLFLTVLATTTSAVATEVLATEALATDTLATDTLATSALAVSPDASPVPASAAEVYIELGATVTAPGTISGTMRVTCEDADGSTSPCPSRFHLVDPLAMLPNPPDDHTALRTWVGAPDQGAVTWTPSDLSAPEPLAFTTRLPLRYGDIGYASRSSDAATHANAGWYPLLLDGTQVVTARWSVSVQAKGVVVVNGTVGTDLAHWEGNADRAALSVLPRGRIHEEPDLKLTLVTEPGLTPITGRLGRRLLTKVDAELVPTDAAPAKVTLVQSTDLRHLVRAAPGMVYVSDRTFRLLWLFRPYHARAVRQAIIEATTPLPSGWDRAFVADAVARSLPAPDLRRTLGWLTWNPAVDALLNDGTLPFYGDIFPEAFDDDPQLIDVVEGRIAARAAARQLDDLLGKGAALIEARRRISDPSAPSAVPEPLQKAWSRPYDTNQDYALRTEQARVVAVDRLAGPDALPEVVTLTLNGVPTPWLTAGGAESLLLPSGTTEARIDAQAHVADLSRANNRWPARWDVILSGGVGGISPTQRNIDVWGSLLLRPHGDSHNRAIGIADHDQQDILSVSAGYIRTFGPLLNRQVRAHRILALITTSYLDPAFRPTTSGAIAVGAMLGWTTDTRTDDAAMHGRRVGVSMSGGLVPSSDERWASAGVSATQLVPLLPRQVLAVRAKAGWASGAVEHRLLTLGGAGDLRSIPASLYLANEKLLANLEYRVALFRNAQLPIPLLWWTELQVAPGAEYGVAWRNDGTMAQAVGGSLGVHTLSDGLGARPMLFGATLAAPLWTAGLPELNPIQNAQIYLDFAQPF